ncbi:hypothetical protein GI374_15985 [Paracoccus sp. S-4012]|uniref:hypothetical protein n=1 Tax=Paracoccus sp. S-4012 TaxID=2665648 RepID=UPI0012B150BA|nr:hypothetical protein [Paracoccus sp. S-4012]MRX51891.1 hypothetical protein [Paracoccus sp. S-4012]
MSLAVSVEEATHEGRVRLAEAPDGQRLLRTLRRVRQDIDMLRRAAREGGSDALHESAAASWQSAAESAAASLRAIREVFAGQPVPEDFDPLAPAVRNFRTAVEDMREAGVARTLSTAELGRLFGIGFALDQLRHDLGDLMEGAREASALRRRFTAAS